MNTDDELLHHSHTAQQKTAASFKSLKPLALLSVVIFLTVISGIGGYLFGIRKGQELPFPKLRLSNHLPTITPLITISQPSLIPEVPYYQFDEIEMIVRARKDLANRLNVEPLNIEIIVLEKVIWPDTCLEAPKQSNCSVKVDVPGYKIIFEALDKKYEYHTGGEYHRSIDL